MFKYVSATNISYCLPSGRPLFNNINLTVTPDTKSAIIGKKNGIGKTTLLRILAGEIHRFNGTVKMNADIAYMPQNLSGLSGSVSEVIGISEVLSAIQRIEQGDAEQGIIDFIGNNWDIESKAHRELSRFGLNSVDINRDIKTFSGGEIARILFAGVFLSEADIILFDEPTNNIDYPTKRLFFIDRVFDCNKGIIAATHDRELLDRVESIYELTSKGIKTYGGNYEFYREEKKREIENQQSKITSLERSKKKNDQ